MECGFVFETVIISFINNKFIVQIQIKWKMIELFYQMFYSLIHAKTYNKYAYAYA